MGKRTSRSVAAKSLILLTSALMSAAVAPAGFAAENEASVTSTATPIKHVVVIFQENVSFDHYFATYPNAANLPGEPRFKNSSPSTPSVNGINDVLHAFNPNSAAPFRLSRAQNYTCDQNHDYTPEQQANNGGMMNKFVETVGVGSTSCPNYGLGKSLVMGYYDGNTVTAMWNLAQHFAMSDNSFNTTYGPSTPGVLNLVSGQTGGLDTANTRGDLTGAVIENSVIGDPDPFYDDCGNPAQEVAVTGKNVGDLLSAAGITWGWFQGGFAPSSRNPDGTAVCNTTTPNLGGVSNKAYSAHHEPFQYYKSTSNPHHLPATSVAMIGHTDQANHQYDLADFYNAVKAHNLPAVSFVKATKSQDGHSGYSSPLDEQAFVATVLNTLQKSPDWGTTAVIIAWDDSDGWYDHVMPPLVNPSTTSADALTGAGSCGSGDPLGGIQGRCGYGPRLPLLVVSPFSKVNFVDHSVTDQSSILRFIEDNWNLGRIGGGSFDEIAGALNNMFDFSHRPHTAPVLLSPATGLVSTSGADTE
jgi:phospholipase C